MIPILLFYFNTTRGVANMDIQQIGELLIQILQRLEDIHTQGHLSMSQLADRRRQSLEGYRRAYHRGRTS